MLLFQYAHYKNFNEIFNIFLSILRLHNPVCIFHFQYISVWTRHISYAQQQMGRAYDTRQWWTRQFPYFYSCKTHTKRGCMALGYLPDSVRARSTPNTLASSLALCRRANTVMEINLGLPWDHKHSFTVIKIIQFWRSTYYLRDIRLGTLSLLFKTTLQNRDFTPVLRKIDQNTEIILPKWPHLDLKPVLQTTKPGIFLIHCKPLPI